MGERSRNPDLGAQAGGYAGQARPGYAGQLGPEDWNFCDIGATNVKGNEVGRARFGRARTHWAINHSGLHACFKAAPWRSYGASSARAHSAHLVPARHGASSAHLVPARHCPLHGASSAPGCQLSYKCPLGTGVPARHVPARHI